jgi:8-oxo-dGTP pyrophosphatase MutT (NUDIX family)
MQTTGLNITPLGLYLCELLIAPHMSPTVVLPQVLLIRRAKEPAKGQWCFPGGSLELGGAAAAGAAAAAAVCVLQWPHGSSSITSNEGKLVVVSQAERAAHNR